MYVVCDMVLDCHHYTTDFSVMRVSEMTEYKTYRVVVPTWLNSLLMLLPMSVVSNTVPSKVVKKEDWSFDGALVVQFDFLLCFLFIQIHGKYSLLSNYIAVGLAS